MTNKVKRAVEYRLRDVANNLQMNSEERSVINEAVDELIGLRNRFAATLRQARWDKEKLACFDAFHIEKWEGYDEAMSEYYAQTEDW